MVIVGWRENRQILARNLGLSIMGLSRGGHSSDLIMEKDSIGLAMKTTAVENQKCGVGEETSVVNTWSSSFRAM
jgi:hypothetical protein